jgi:hypothetical protein
MSKLDDILIQFDGTPYTRRVNKNAKVELLNFLIKELPDTETTNEEEYRQYTIDALNEIFGVNNEVH